jgi:hypothetical protein
MACNRADYSRELRPAEGVSAHFAKQQFAGPNVCAGSLADMAGGKIHVRFASDSGHQAVEIDVRQVPFSTICSAAQTESLFDYLVGAAQQCERDGETERLGRLEVDCKVDFGGLLYRQVSRLRALENPPGINAKLTVI